MLVIPGSACFPGGTTMAALDSEIAQTLFSMIPLMHSALIKPFESLLRDDISPMQFYTLTALSRCGCMTMSELACYFGIPKQQMTKIINHLVEIGVVERTADASDRRLIKVCIRPDATNTILNYREKTCKRFAEAISSLSDEEKTSLCEAAGIIKTILPKLCDKNK